jgi:hypothetical protein
MIASYCPFPEKEVHVKRGEKEAIGVRGLESGVTIVSGM